jgi:hypothetical protein
MLSRVALLGTEVSEELNVSFIRVARIGGLGTTIAITRNQYLVFLRSVRRLLVKASVVPSPPILVTLMNEALNASETSVLTRATRRNITEDTIPLIITSTVLNFHMNFYGTDWDLEPGSLAALSLLDLSRTNRINKQTPWPLVRKRTIPTERPSLVDEI